MTIQLDSVVPSVLFSNRGRPSYPITYDLCKKMKSPMYRYLKKVLELSQQGEPMLAVKALRAITDTVIKSEFWSASVCMQTLRQWGNWRVLATR